MEWMRSDDLPASALATRRSTSVSYIHESSPAATGGRGERISSVYRRHRTSTRSRDDGLSLIWTLGSFGVPDRI